MSERESTTMTINPIGQALPCEHAKLVGLEDSNDPRECQECDWCNRCEAVRRYDATDTCTHCGREWGED